MCWKVTAGAGVVLLLVGVPSATAAESLDGGCPVVAAAQGVQVMVSASDNLLLAAPLGAGVPVAQACVDYGVKETSGFASSPYPGETVVTAAGLARGVTDLPIPDYPAYAASRYPSAPESGVEQQGYSLRSRSDETSSSAQARSGLGEDAGSAGSSMASAESSVDPGAGSSAATARAGTEPLTINEVLRLGEVRSVATARVGRDGKLERGSELTVGRTTVAGQAVEITPDGVKAADQGAALPDTVGPEEALAEAGVRVGYLRAEQTQRGVLSAGIEVRVRQQDQETGAVYTVQYVFGRAFAAAAPPEEGPGESADLPLPAVGAGDAGPPESGPAPAEAAPADAAPADAGVPEMAEAPAVAGDAPAPSAAPADVGLAGFPVDLGAAGLYLVIVFGAIAMFASATLLRLLGVRTRWTN